MQQIIAFLINLFRSLISLCMSNELLSWTIYLFIFACIVSAISVLWRTKDDK